MKLIDYDALFHAHMERWLAENRERYGEDADALEEALEDQYIAWLETQRGTLDGVTLPELMEMMLAYAESGMSVPDLVSERIVQFGEQAEAPLFALLKQDLTDELKMLVMNLLAELQSVLPLDTYIRWVARSKKEDDIADNAVEALGAMGLAARDAAVEGYRMSETTWARDRFADILSNYPFDDEVYALLEALFTERPSAMTAVWLGKLEDVRALPAFYEQLSNREINYLDYLEIRNAIEQLGGEIRIQRDFSGDAYYEALKEIDGVSN